MAEKEYKDSIEDKLTVQRFAWSQVSQLLLQLGGAVAGYFAGKGVAKIGNLSEKAGSWASKIPMYGEMLGKNTKEAGATTITLIGTFVGLAVGGIASSYRHWRRGEAERLAVKEMNKDTADLMEKRIQTENLLHQQAAEVEKFLAEERKRSHSHSATPATNDTHAPAAHETQHKTTEAHTSSMGSHVIENHRGVTLPEEKVAGFADKLAKPKDSHAQQLHENKTHAEHIR